MCPVYAVVVVVGVGGTARFGEEKRSTVLCNHALCFFAPISVRFFISLFIVSASASWVGLDVCRAHGQEGYLNDYENVFRLGWIGAKKQTPKGLRVWLVLCALRLRL